MTSSPNFSSAAFRLALRGLRVFPLTPGTKRPLARSHGFHDATAEVDAIRARWKRTPKANVGIATGAGSNLWVLDVDVQHHGAKTLERLTEEHGELPETVAVVTPSRGFHLWWRWPTDGTAIRNSASRIGPGLDVRGEGGYCIAPPSRLSDGSGCAWVKGPDAILPAPEWLLRLAAPPKVLQRCDTPKRKCGPRGDHPQAVSGDIDNYVAAAVADELRELMRAHEGRRNDQLNRSAFAVAGFVKAGYIPSDWATAKLESIAVEIGLSLPEARRTIASAFLAAEPREVAS